MLNTDNTAALLLSGMLSGPAALAVKTAKGLPEGETRRKLLEMAEGQLSNLHWRVADLLDMIVEEEDEGRRESLLEEAMDIMEETKRCGAAKNEKGLEFPWGRTMRDGVWYDT